MGIYNPIFMYHRLIYMMNLTEDAKQIVRELLLPKINIIYTRDKENVKLIQ